MARLFAYDRYVRIATDSALKTFDSAMVGDVHSGTQISRIYGVKVMDISDEPETPATVAWGGFINAERDFRNTVTCELIPMYVTNPGQTAGHDEMFENDFIDLRNQRRAIASGSGWLVDSNLQRQIDSYKGSGSYSNLYSDSAPLRIVLTELKKSLKSGNQPTAAYSTVTFTLKAIDLA